MESAYSRSITDNEETVDMFLVNSYSDLLSKLNLIHLRNGWITHVSDNNPLFFIKIIILETGPFIDRSVLVDDNLYIKAFDNKNATIPISRISINDTRKLRPSSMKLIHFHQYFKLIALKLNILLTTM